jgi:two-component system phosphate regulon sensor histidine kinase PhoR
VAVALVLLAGVLVLVGLVLARRRRSAAVAPGLDQLPWLISLLNGLPDAALVADASARPLAWNSITERTLGLKDESTTLPPSLVALVQRAVGAGTPETSVVSIPGLPHHRLHATASPLGKDVGALVLLHSPTQESRSAESYRSLIGAVTHELRTPLTAILGHAEILASCDPVAEQALWHRSQDFIAREARRLSRLVEDLSTLSRLDRTPLQRSPVNIRAVAEQAISALFHKAEARGVQLSLHSPPDLPRVLGDRDRLDQVFINLLDNAVKYTPAGGCAGVHLNPQDECVEAQVRDNGVGIPPEDLPYIFDALYRSEHIQDTPGTGLGLTIVRAVLEQHGAAISVESTLGQGTTFQFYLLRASADAVALTPRLLPETERLARLRSEHR